MPPTSAMRGIVFSLTCLVLLGSMPVIANARSAGIDALPFALALSAWQTVFALPVFGAELLGRNKGIFEVSLRPAQLARILIVGVGTGMIFGLSTFLYVLGVEMAGAANAAIAMQAYPLMAIAIESIFLGQRKTAPELGLTFMLLVALYYLGTASTFVLSGLSPWFLLTLCVPLLWAIAHIVIRRELRRFPITPAQVTLLRVTVSTLTLFVILVLVAPARFASLGLEALLQPMAALMGLVYFLELIVWFYAIRHIEVSLASTITTPWPALTMVLAALLLGDAIAPYQIGALVVVIAAIYGLTLAGLKRDRTRQAA